MYNRTMCIVKCDMMPNDVISFHTVQCLWQIGVTWDSNKVLFFYISELIILVFSLLNLTLVCRPHSCKSSRTFMKITDSSLKVKGSVLSQ